MGLIISRFRVRQWLFEVFFPLLSVQAEIGAECRLLCAAAAVLYPNLVIHRNQT